MAAGCGWGDPVTKKNTHTPPRDSFTAREPRETRAGGRRGVGAARAGSSVGSARQSSSRWSRNCWYTPGSAGGAGSSRSSGCTLGRLSPVKPYSLSCDMLLWSSSCSTTGAGARGGLHRRVNPAINLGDGHRGGQGRLAVAHQPPGAPIFPNVRLHIYFGSGVLRHYFRRLS